MAHSLHASILFRLARVRIAPVEPDPADHGTAFGLEMSLEPPAALPDRADDAEPMAWLQRLGLRQAR